MYMRFGFANPRCLTRIISPAFSNSFRERLIVISHRESIAASCLIGKYTNRIPFSSSNFFVSIASSILQYITFAVLLIGSRRQNSESGRKSSKKSTNSSKSGRNFHLDRIEVEISTTPKTSPKSAKSSKAASTSSKNTAQTTSKTTKSSAKSLKSGSKTSQKPTLKSAKTSSKASSTAKSASSRKTAATPRSASKKR